MQITHVCSQKTCKIWTSLLKRRGFYTCAASTGSSLNSAAGATAPMQPNLNIPTRGRVFFVLCTSCINRRTHHLCCYSAEGWKAPILCHWHETVCPVLLFICGLFCDYMYVTWHWINKRRQKRRVLKLIPAQTRGWGGGVSLADNSWLTFLPFCNL